VTGAVADVVPDEALFDVGAAEVRQRPCRGEDNESVALGLELADDGEELLSRRTGAGGADLGEQKPAASGEEALSTPG